MAHTPEQNRSSSSFFSSCFLLIWSTLSFPVGWWILILFPNSCIPNRISSNQITVHNKPMFLYGFTLNNIDYKPCKKKKQNTTLEHQTWFILTQPPTRKKEKKTNTSWTKWSNGCCFRCFGFHKPPVQSHKGSCRAGHKIRQRSWKSVFLVRCSKQHPTKQQLNWIRFVDQIVILP